MNVLITHERSGTVCEAMRAQGHSAFSCDLEPRTDGNTKHHIQGDALEAIRRGRPTDGAKWHLIGMHPECRFLTVSGLHWNNRGRGWDKTNAALKHVKDCMETATASGAKWYLENSISIISTHIRKPDQIIQPYQFGEDASKATCLWLYGLHELVIDPAQRFNGRMVMWHGKQVERWGNQTDSGQNKLAPSATRSADRAKTYPGIAKAMAQQWSEYTFHT